MGEIENIGLFKADGESIWWAAKFAIPTRQEFVLEILREDPFYPDEVDSLWRLPAMIGEVKSIYLRACVGKCGEWEGWHIHPTRKPGRGCVPAWEWP